MDVADPSRFCLGSDRADHPRLAQVPKSVALPFGTFERVLKDEANAAAAKQIGSLQKQLVRFLMVSSS